MKPKGLVCLGHSCDNSVNKRCGTGSAGKRLKNHGTPVYIAPGKCDGRWERRKNMARIAGVDLPRDKRIEYGLTYIYGIGLATSREILAKAGVDPDIRVRDLTEEDAGKIRRVIDAEYMVEGDLRREVSLNIKRLMEIGSYRGIRHRRGLPVRGQKTKTNARTRKGPKRLAGKKR